MLEKKSLVLVLKLFKLDMYMKKFFITLTHTHPLSVGLLDSTIKYNFEPFLKFQYVFGILIAFAVVI